MTSVAKVIFGLLLTVSLSVASAQDAELAAWIPFDESLLEIPEGESSAFYVERYEALSKAIREYSAALRRAGARETILPKGYLEANLKLQKIIAFADDVNPYLSTNCFEIYTERVSRKGDVDELKEILKSELSKEEVFTSRVYWVRDLINRLELKNAKDVAELEAAIKDVDAAVADDDFVAKNVYEYALTISANAPDEAKAFLARTIEAFKASDSDVRKELAEKLEPKRRFIDLVGNEMIFEGVYDDGTEIDWKSYRGKVVLVVFWASWRGQSVDDIRNVRNLYKKYHNAGFDVVGYSLDDDLDYLAIFRKENRFPRRTGVRKLSMQANEKDGKNYTDLTEYYGIDDIPVMILVDKDGKVISLDARGERLQELLEKAFPDVK